MMRRRRRRREELKVVEKEIYVACKSKFSIGWLN
jgi:hypothetical protein